MTEVEFSRLLAELSDTAKTLNLESDSINDVIASLEHTLREINLGLDVWLTDQPLESEAVMEDVPYGHEPQETGNVFTELGFTKLDGTWQLVVREATYKYNDRRGLDFKGAPEPLPLRACNRELRIDALARFPRLLAAMKAKADAALKAIADAKKFVK